MAVDPYHRYSNETERNDKDIYDDFKSKKPFCLHRLYKIFQRFEGSDLFVGAALTRVNVIEVLRGKSATVQRQSKQILYGIV